MITGKKYIKDVNISLILLMVSEDFSTYMELHSDFDCIYLDFAKAFDRVSHHSIN